MLIGTGDWSRHAAYRLRARLQCKMQQRPRFQDRPIHQFRYLHPQPAQVSPQPALLRLCQAVNSPLQMNESAVVGWNEMVASQPEAESRKPKAESRKPTYFSTASDLGWAPNVTELLVPASDPSDLTVNSLNEAEP